MLGLSDIDLICLGIFLVTWFGYTLFADRDSLQRHSLMSAMHNNRLQWMREMLKRDTRIMDAQIISMTMRNVGLFASISVLILGGVIAILGTLDRAQAFVEHFPYAAKASAEVLELKIIFLGFVFTYAFFKFAWSIRQFNYFATLMGGAPSPDEPDRHEKAAHKMADIGSLAVSSYNRGIRAYYYGMAMLLWILHPVAMAVSVIFVAGVIYRREFRSKTLEGVSQEF